MPASFALAPPFALADASASAGGRQVLDAVTLAGCPGQVLGIVGPNGAGKTTALRALLGLIRLDAGTAALGGRPVHSLSAPQRAALAAYLPQERRIGWNLPAWRIAALGAPDATPGEAARRAHAALERVGLASGEKAGLADRGVLDMSGGERGRALLARLLVADAPLLVADEPAAGLDPDAQLLALEIFRQEAARGASVVVTLHDLSLAARFCDRIAVIHRGRVVADADPREALRPQVLQQVFGLHGALQDTPAGLVLAAGRQPHDATSLATPAPTIPRTPT